MIGEQQRKRLEQILESLEWLEIRKKDEVYSDAKGLAGLHRELKDRGFIIKKFFGGYVVRRNPE